MDVGHEQFADIPDKFYLNEMRREVIAITQTPFEDELFAADGYVDIPTLANMVTAADSTNPDDYTQLISEYQEVHGGLWLFFGHSINQVRADRGYEREDPRGTAIALCSAAIRVARVLDVVKVSAIGAGASTHFTNAFSATLSSAAARSLVANNNGVFEVDSAQFTRSLAGQAFDKIGYAAHLESWSWAKVHVAAEALTKSLEMRDILTGLPEIGAVDAEMLKRQNEAMGQAAQQLRTYGAKPAVGRLEGTDIRSLFIDREVTKDILLGRKNRSDFTAIQLYPGVDLTSSSARFEHVTSFRNRGGHSKRLVVEDLGPSDTARHTDILLHKGSSLSFLGSDLDTFASGLGLSKQATLLTSMILAQNFDLTVPAYIVELANEEAEHIESEPEQPAIVDRMRRLLLARTRALNVLGPDIDQAMQDDLDETTKHQPRDMAKHDVIDHLRRLPPGYGASPEARALCLEEFGQEIPEGHTYVRRHNRGNIDAPHKGHEMVKNPRATNIGRVTLSSK